jgi:hypothetical protein
LRLGATFSRGRKNSYKKLLSGSSSSSSSSSSSEEEEDVPLQHRRRAAQNVSYNMKEYDEMIKKALADEEEEYQVSVGESLVRPFRKKNGRKKNIFDEKN